VVVGRVEFGRSSLGEAVRLSDLRRTMASANDAQAPAPNRPAQSNRLLPSQRKSWCAMTCFDVARLMRRPLGRMLRDELFSALNRPRIAECSPPIPTPMMTRKIAKLQKLHDVAVSRTPASCHRRHHGDGDAAVRDIVWPIRGKRLLGHGCALRVRPPVHRRPQPNDERRKDVSCRVSLLWATGRAAWPELSGSHG
jgi:hypothetical protein